MNTPALTFDELALGDRFRAADALWTKLSYHVARKHGAASTALGDRGYGYSGDAFCSFEPTDTVVFVPVTG